MSDALGQDQFQPVNRRAGYGDALEMALSAARKGWTLSAGQGALIVEHYEEKLAATIGERESFMHRMYEARDDADRAERQFNIVTDMLVEQASLLTHYEEKLDHIDTLTRERDALTMHMNQVHATLGGTDTVLTLEAAQHVVFERDEAVKRRREIDDEAFDYAEQIETLRTQLAAERAVIEAAKAIRDAAYPPKSENYREYMTALGNLVAAVTALRALEEEDA